MNWLSLDLQYFAGEKTEKATPKKREDTRKKGQVAKSQDITTSLLMLAVFILFIAIGGYLKERFIGILEHSFNENMGVTLTEESTHKILVDMTVMTATTIAPVMGIAVLAGVAANYMQIGFLFSTEPLKVQLNKLNPIEGAKKIFSARALVELLKSLLKIALVGTITFTIIWMRRSDMMETSQKGIDASLAFFSETTITMGIAASLGLLFISVIDYTYQRYDHEKNIRMSKHDIKDEYKNSEGDPQIKSKIKERQRQMSMQRMMSEVPEADVVITNPTHYAIAIKYDEKKADAPYVVAKGVDYVAQRIKEVANNHDVVMVENRPLARGLYDTVEINETIDEQFYQAVAEVLAYVYRVQKKA
ncbi:flagellar biosynthesis protein FlhB [Pontibacillus halophilus JSM 076056 = DSM 19796]|uniref:Flagellar biosynthetic protein FlhB n=1 Tax=Pontibacillus halophilus JSM 076056 = DSM 19796 TaxID=1385510 RepID=A0A0A5IBE0_9BACI|nr:flagellar biosynthesis protein FlhB [Pontibacillus halophilus]KGX93157.1 flagellar biosynthesis protein FlhB [Pontibacillus halophilus JSM 076056 = DSM 19796]